MNRLILFCSLLIVLVVGGCVEDYQIGNEILDKYSAKYDSDILKQFENNSEVLVIAFLDEFNDERCYFEDRLISEECITIYKERWKRNFKYENKVLSESAAWTFRLERKGISTPSLTGYVSKKGFEELIKHQNVSYILFYDLSEEIYSKFDIIKDVNHPRKSLINLAIAVDSKNFIELGDDFGYNTGYGVLHIIGREAYNLSNEDVEILKDRYSSQIANFEIFNEVAFRRNAKFESKIRFVEGLKNADKLTILECLKKDFLSKDYVEDAYFDFDKIGFVEEN